jgi:bifunctional DNase/RNase
MARTAALLLLTLVVACDAERSGGPAADEVLVHVSSIALDPSNTPVVILEEDGGPRVLPIWIGAAEATSIASQIRHLPSPRPNFHDLAERLIQKLDAKVTRVVVTELRGGTYYAILALRTKGRMIEIDVRPSDGIAVALRAHAPILVRASVFDDAGEVLRGEDDSGEPIAWSPDGREPGAAGEATPGRSL